MQNYTFVKNMAAHKIMNGNYDICCPSYNPPGKATQQKIPGLFQRPGIC